MEPTSAFAASGEEAIAQTIDLHEVPDALTPEELEEYYDIERTSEQIRQGDFKRVDVTYPMFCLTSLIPIYIDRTAISRRAVALLRSCLPTPESKAR